MRKNLYVFLGVASVCILILTSILFGCKKDDDEEIAPQSKVYEYEAIRSYCDPIAIGIQAGQKVSISTTDSVITNINGSVEDCDYWTDADGIADCHYIDDNPDLHGLSFMALIGKFNDEYFLVGTQYVHTFSSAGTLELSVNDWGGCGAESDNVGKFVITVLIE